MFGSTTQSNLDAFLEIELFQNNAYVAGQPLYGKIHLHAKNNINNVDCITLGLQGSEQIVLHINKMQKNGSAIMKQNQVIDQWFTQYSYTDYFNVIQGGSYSYPFTITLPAWLPQSSLCINSDETKNKGSAQKTKVNQFRVFYDLVACVLPTEKCDNVVDGCC